MSQASVRLSRKLLVELMFSLTIRGFLTIRCFIIILLANIFAFDFGITLLVGFRNVTNGRIKRPFLLCYLKNRSQPCLR